MMKHGIATKMKGRILLQDPFEVAHAEEAIRDWLERDRFSHEQGQRVVRCMIGEEEWADLEIRAKSMDLSVGALVSFGAYLARKAVPGDVVSREMLEDRPDLFDTREDY